MVDTDDELGYTGPPSVVDEGDQVTEPDVDNLDTLKELKKDFDSLYESLGTTSAIDLKEEKMSVKEQIGAHQLAQELVEPLKNRLDAAIQSAELKVKG